MADTDHIAPILRKLTVNAGITLKHQKQPTVGEPLSGRVFTGLGKFTSLAADGVISNMRVNGLVIEVGPHRTARLTPLGVQVALYLMAHWDDVSHLLRDPPVK